MGFRDWLPGSGDTPKEEADRLRGAALDDPDSVDVERLIELFQATDERGVARSAAKGIEAVARERPGRLADHVAPLLDAATPIEGAGSDHRGELGTAVQRVAEVDPDAVAAVSAALCAALERELEAEDRPGNDVRLNEEKTAALCQAIAAAGVSDARPLLLKLRRHNQPAVGEAAREAIREL